MDLQRKTHVLFVIDHQDRREGPVHLDNLIKILAGNSTVKPVPFPSSEWTVNGAAVHFGIMFDDGQAQAGALGAGW